MYPTFPYLPQPFWPFCGGPTKPYTCLPPLLLSVPPDPSPPHLHPPPQSSPRFPLLHGTALVLIWHLCEGHISAASFVGPWGMPVHLSVPQCPFQRAIDPDFIMQRFPLNVIKMNITHKRKCSYILFITNPFKTRGSS